MLARDGSIHHVEYGFMNSRKILRKIRERASRGS